MKHCHKHDPIKAIMISHQNGLEQTGPVKQQQQMVKAQLALLLPDELWSTYKSWGRARVVCSYLATDETTKL